MGADGAAEVLELAQELGCGGEAGGKACGGGEDAVEGGGRVEIGGAAGAPEEEGEGERVGGAAGDGCVNEPRRERRRLGLGGEEGGGESGRERRCPPPRGVEHRSSE